MADCNNFEPLRSLPRDVLDEVVREAEVRLAAQLQMASAADQRALTIAGFQIAAATASLGGGVALAVGTKADVWLAIVAVMFAFAMVLSAREAVLSAQPQKFHVPGNRPIGWLPENWLDGATKGHNIIQARIEQAACLDEAITENALDMDFAGAKVRRSLTWSIAAVGAASLILFATLISRNFTIREPTSEIIRVG
jgi:hypothetical protein